MDAKLKICSYNVQGLRNDKKRSVLMNMFKKENYDVVCLQETHLLNDELRQLESLWKGPLHVSEGTKRSKGICTLFSVNYKEEQAKIIYRDDRVIISSLAIEQETLMVINVYAPCIDKEKAQFLAHLERLIEDNVSKGNPGNIVCLGDFNLVVNNSLEIISGKKHDESLVKEFQNFIVSSNFVDAWRTIHPDTRDYTWRRGNPPIARRLDYVFLSQPLVPFLESSIISTVGFSDHRLVSILLRFHNFKRGKGLYKLNVSLLKDIQYVQLIKKVIEECSISNGNLNPHLRWEMLKTKVRETSQQYSRFKNSGNRCLIKEMVTELNKLEKELCEYPKDKDLIHKIVEKRRELELTQIKLNQGAQIRAGLKWAEEGERCTKYFLSLEKSRRVTNTIYKIKKSNGIETSNEVEIIREIKSFYQSLYRDTSNACDVEVSFKDFTEGMAVPSLSEEQSERVEAKIQETEILEALKKMKNGSSPGTDGIPVEFYKVFWSDIKDFLEQSFRHSFESGVLSPSQRHGVISLLHKGKELTRDDLGNWRPLSLTNVDYKLIAKVFALRIAKVIDSLVGEQQFGFIKGRSISTLIREVDDIFDYNRSIDFPGVSLIIDFLKAYDTIKTSYIINSLDLFGFGPNFMKWMRILMSERTACVKNGGYISEKFSMDRGVRQGCPLSPLLFV